MTFDLKKLLPHILIILGFIVASLAYFNPVLSGEKIFQSDIQQSRGMTRQADDFRKEHQEETYWVDNAFGGMPSYLINKRYPDNFIRNVDKTIRFLPRPADYLFLYFVGLYVLFLVLKIDYKLAAVGALAFGFSTYLIIILGVGHNAKAHAIAYMPLVLAGIFSVFRKKYFWGGILLALSLALEIYTGHFQITYYLLLVVLIIGIAHLYQAFKDKKLKEFFTAIGVMVIALILGIASNATTLLTSKEYTDFSTRGDTGLTISKDGSEKPSSGLSYEYITEYSYGIAETMNLFIPRFMGGASTESLDENSNSYQSLIDYGLPAPQAKEIVQNLPTYWGEQPIVAAPNYVGASVIFLFILALYLVKGRLKWWVVGSGILALLLSWGDHFSILTKFFIDYIPLYSKFRTVSMVQIILQFLIPFFGIYGLSKIFSDKIDLQEKTHALKWATIITGGVSLFFLLFKNMLFDFSGAYDSYYLQNLGPDFVDAIKQDRIDMLNADAIRSLIFVLISALIIYAFLKNKLKQNLSIGLFAVLILIDLISVDKKYVNKKDFIKPSEYATAFQAYDADKQIMKDKEHFKVLDLSTNPMNSARASYFHSSLGGYHAAKPGRMQELYDFHIAEGRDQVINMLNTKYFILENDGEVFAQLNPDRNGPAWFVNKVLFVDSANEEIKALDSINTKKTAVVNSIYKDNFNQQEFASHSEDQIHLESYQPNELTYSYTLQEDRFAVFSEIYYPKGWEVKIDGKEVEMIPTNYVLRGVILPKGEHEITFKFDPRIIKVGSSITLSTGILFLILIIGGVFFNFKKRKNLNA